MGVIRFTKVSFPHSVDQCNPWRVHESTIGKPTKIVASSSEKPLQVNSSISTAAGQDEPPACTTCACMKLIDDAIDDVVTKVM